jgi:hypothetical protein
MMSLPNLVIGGAPKCGTSSISSWLADHPQACGSKVKETFYLMDEGHPLRHRDSNYQQHGLDGYRQYFENSSADQRIIFEATTHYLYQQTALEVLASLDPMPQIVFVLRKPSERVYSSFQYSKNNLANVRRELTFSRFVDELGKTSDSTMLREYARESAFVLSNDIKYSRYIEYLTTWVERFGTERVHVLLFEDMKRDPRGFMQTLARRIDIDPRFYDNYNFQAKNETVNLKYLSLHRGARKLNGVIPRSGLRNALKSVYLKAQARESRNGRSAADRQSLNELDRHFQPFNRRLAKELSLDLAVWD